MSIRLSQAGIVSKQLDESSWFLAWRLSSTYPHCVVRKFGYLKIRILSSVTMSQTPDLENSATARQLRFQQILSSLTVEFVDDTYMTILESWLFTTSWPTVTL